MRHRALFTLVTLAVVAPLAAACGGAGKPATTGATSVAPSTGQVTSAPGTTAATTATVPSGPVTTSSQAGLPFTATLVVPGRIGKVNVSWPYVLHVTDTAGKPIKARITAQIVDPLQQPHPVEYDGTTKNIIAWPIKGEFKDDIVWPPDARGFTLTFRIIVNAKGGTATLAVPVTVQ